MNLAFLTTQRKQLINDFKLMRKNRNIKLELRIKNIEKIYFNIKALELKINHMLLRG